jgi:cytochrome P450
MAPLHDEHGDVAGWSLGPRRQVTLFHPDDGANVLSGTGTALRKGFSEGFSKKAGLIGNIVLAMSKGEVWKCQRRIVQPGIHSKLIAGYTTMVVRYAEEMVTGLRPEDLPDLHRNVVQLTQPIAVRTLFGQDLTKAEGDEVKQALEEMSHSEEAKLASVLGMLPPWVPAPNQARLCTASARVEELVMRAVRQRREEDEAGTDSGQENDLLAMLLDSRDYDGSLIAESQLRDEVHILCVAGHETTSNTLGFLWVQLARRPAMAAQLEE